MVTANYYRQIIAKGILFSTIDSIVSSKKLGGYKANMNAYLMSSISFLAGQNLILHTFGKSKSTTRSHR